jgi:AraC-like DNA-binding protein/mannose-6-phosphate isomerase-like protein (cupin superfamily)
MPGRAHTRAPIRPPQGRNRTLTCRYEPWRLGAARLCAFTDYRLSDAPILDAHRHDVLELCFCQEGAATFLVGGKTYDCVPGEVLAIGPREDHRARAHDAAGSRWWFLHLDLPGLLDGIADPEGVAAAAGLCGDGFPNRLDPDGRAAQVARLLVAAARDRSPAWRSELRGLTLALLAQLRRLPGDLAVGAAPPERLDPALRRMAAHFRRSLSIPQLARACGLGETTFRRAFAVEFGHGPKEHLIRLRLAHAVTRLRAGDAVEAAAQDAGFASARMFHRAFRARHGCAPRAWLEGGRGATPA